MRSKFGEIAGGLSSRATWRMAALMVLFALLGARGLLAQEPPTAEPAPRCHSLRLTLPPKLYVVAGHETNIYFDNIVLALRPEAYAFDVQCAKGRQQVERWTWTPTAADVGTHAWAVEVRDERNELLAREALQIEVLAADAAANREATILMIGDSLTHASVYPRQVLDRSREPGGPKLRLVGSFGPGEPLGEVRHEGYGGWTALRFATHFQPVARQGDYKLRGSPFVYQSDDDAKKLDFARYIKDVCEGRPPDLATIFLGPNDIFSAKDDTLEATIDTMITHLTQLADAIRVGAPRVELGILLPVPPAATQDAFGSNYGSGQTRWQYKRNQHRLVERLLAWHAERAARASGGLEPFRESLVPTVVNLDCMRHYPVESVPPSSQAEPSDRIVRLSNGVHPAAAGYRQIGDTLYAWCVARLSAK